MAPRPAFRRQEQDDDGPPPSQARPTEERFVLRVDGQTKRSFSSKDAAAAAGAAVKKAYPVVMVTVLDTKDGTIEIVKA